MNTAAHEQRPAARDFTEDELRLAWRVCKLRTWPPTFEEAMEDPQRSRLVRLHAWHIAHPNKRPQAPAEPTAARCPAAAPKPFIVTPPPAFVDRKRAAAGDRDD